MNISWGFSIWWILFVGVAVNSCSADRQEKELREIKAELVKMNKQKDDLK